MDYSQISVLRRVHCRLSLCIILSLLILQIIDFCEPIFYQEIGVFVQGSKARFHSPGKYIDNGLKGGNDLDGFVLSIISHLSEMNLLRDLGENAPGAADYEDCGLWKSTVQTDREYFKIYQFRLEVYTERNKLWFWEPEISVITTWNSNCFSTRDF